MGSGPEEWRHGLLRSSVARLLPSWGCVIPHRSSPLAARNTQCVVWRACLVEECPEPWNALPCGHISQWKVKGKGSLVGKWLLFAYIILYFPQICPLHTVYRVHLAHIVTVTFLEQNKKYMNVQSMWEWRLYVTLTFNEIKTQDKSNHVLRIIYTRLWGN